MHQYEDPVLYRKPQNYNYNLSPEQWHLSLYIQLNNQPFLPEIQSIYYLFSRNQKLYHQWYEGRYFFLKALRYVLTIDKQFAQADRFCSAEKRNIFELYSEIYLADIQILFAFSLIETAEISFTVSFYSFHSIQCITSSEILFAISLGLMNFSTQLSDGFHFLYSINFLQDFFFLSLTYECFHHFTDTKVKLLIFLLFLHIELTYSKKSGFQLINMIFQVINDNLHLFNRNISSIDQIIQILMFRIELLENFFIESQVFEDRSPFILTSLIFSAR